MKMNIRFVKAETNGNDFIIIKDMDLNTQDVRKISDRRYGIGADQIVLYRETHENLYEVKFFNSDGSGADMCGNGLCALTKFLGTESTFVVKGQEHRGKAEDNGMVNITVPPPIEILSSHNCKVIDTGNKHVILLEMAPARQKAEQTHTPNVAPSLNLQHFSFWNEKKRTSLRGIWSRWRAKRTLTKFAEKAVQLSDSKKESDVSAEYNIHFVRVLKDGMIEINSYERGVGNTLSCGSGAIACAFAYGNLKGETVVKQAGGESYVEFLENGNAILKTKPNIVFCGNLASLKRQ